MKIASPHAINIRSAHPPSPVYPELVYPELVVNLQEMKQAEANGDLLLAQEMTVYALGRNARVAAGSSISPFNPVNRRR